MQEEHGKQICGWSYPEPYSVFNWSDWDELAARSEEFGDPGIRSSQYEAVFDEQGLGPSFTQAIVDRARQRTPHNGIDLEVLTSNTRAIRAYAKTGFAIRDTYVRPTPTGPDEFHCMVYEGK
ncbi:MAG: acetyltransferase [Paenibacillus sp.]|nr:acetyltransferase [Paenibacillus sp.]